MSLYSSPNSEVFVKRDLWIISKDAQEYQFCGVTLKGQSLEPNSIPWKNICFAIGPNDYVVGTPTAISLFIDGQEKVRTEHDFVWGDEDIYPKPPDRGHPRDSHKRKVELFWHRMITYLKNRSASSQEAAEILRALATWVNTSLRTLQWLENRIGKSDQSPVEMLVSNTCWLLYYCEENRLVVGNQENVWGETYLPSQEDDLLCATPIKDGWALMATEKSWFLQRKGDGAVELQEVFIPDGKWQRFDSWTYWPSRGAILTPLKRIAIHPGGVDLCGVSFRWAFFSLGQHLVVIDQEGKMYEYEGKMSKQYGLWPRLWVGGSTVLISYREDEFCRFSIVPDHDWPFQRRSKEIVAFPSRTFFYIDALRGYPDTFVVLFKHHYQDKFGVCFININDEVWLFPRLFKIPLAHETQIFSERRSDNQVVIKIPWYKEKPAEVRVSAFGDLVQIDIGDGVAVAGKMTRLPGNRRTALWKLIKSFWQSQDNNDDDEDE